MITSSSTSSYGWLPLWLQNKDPHPQLLKTLNPWWAKPQKLEVWLSSSKVQKKAFDIHITPKCCTSIKGRHWHTQPTQKLNTMHWHREDWKTHWLKSNPKVEKLGRVVHIPKWILESKWDQACRYSLFYITWYSSYIFSDRSTRKC